MRLTSLLFSSVTRTVADDLPPLVQQNIVSLKRLHPHGAHELYVESQALDFIRSHFPAEVVTAFQRLKPFAYKADLARYCILYEYGGVYADLSYFFVKPLPSEPGKITVFRDLFISTPWDTSNGVICAPPRHKALQRAIELVCANVRREYFGPTPLCPTGPALFGKAIASTCDPDELIAGYARRVDGALIRPQMPSIWLPDGAELHCLIHGQKVIAIKRKGATSPGLVSLGVQGGDAYVPRWAKRDIYHPAGSFPPVASTPS